MRFLPLAGVVAVGVWITPTAGQRFSVEIPEEYTYECETTRIPLTTSVIASNPDIYPFHVTRVNGGWLVYDDFMEAVIELDDNLAQIRSWGRKGPGPMEYQRPVAAMRLPSGEVLIVDESPPSFIVLGGESPNEHRLVGLRPEHAMVQDDETILVAGILGDVHVVAANGEILREAASRRSLGLPPELGSGAHPEMLLKPPFVGFVGSSTVWRLGEGEHRHRKVLQRCVHEDLERINIQAPMVRVPVPGVGTVPAPYTVITMHDYLPLADGGFLTFGGLKVNPELDRSIERYDESGELVAAWRLTGHPGAKGAFDPHEPRRILIWDKESIDGVLLVEVDDQLFPADPQGHGLRTGSNRPAAGPGRPPAPGLRARLSHRPGARR